MKNPLQYEPVRVVSAIIVILESFFGLARAMNWFSLSEEQESALLEFIRVAGPHVVTVVVALGLGEWARRRVYPAAKVEEVVVL